MARSKKDGYTLVYTNNPAIVYSRIISPDTVRYDPDKDLEPLGLHLFFAHAIAVQASSPWRTIKDLLDYAKANPDKLRVSTSGTPLFSGMVPSDISLRVHEHRR